MTAITDRSRIEQETIIDFNEEEKTANVYTFNKPLIRRLMKLAEERPSECRIIKADSERAEFEVPKKWVKVKPPANRVLTDEQRAAVAERLQAARKS